MNRSRVSFTHLFDQSQAFWPEAATGCSLIAPAIYRLHEHLSQRADTLFAAYGLQSAEFEALFALRTSPAPHRMTPTELYRKLLVSSGGMSKILARLEDKRLIDRPANPEDARSRQVALTARGKTLIEEVTEKLLQQEAQLVALIDQPEALQQSLVGWLQKIEQD